MLESVNITYVSFFYLTITLGVFLNSCYDVKCSVFETMVALLGVFVKSFYQVVSLEVYLRKWFNARKTRSKKILIENTKYQILIEIKMHRWAYSVCILYSSWLNPSHPLHFRSCIKIKVNLNFYFHILCDTSKGFMKSPIEVPQRNLKIKFKLVFSLLPGSRREGLMYIYFGRNEIRTMDANYINLVRAPLGKYWGY